MNEHTEPGIVAVYVAFGLLWLAVVGALYLVGFVRESARDAALALLFWFLALYVSPAAIIAAGLGVGLLTVHIASLIS